MSIKILYRTIFLKLFFISIILVTFDQITKYIIKSKLLYHDSIVIIENFFNITYVLNPGGAFGLFANQSSEIRKFVFIFLTSIIICFVLWLYAKVASKGFNFLSTGLAMIFAGAIGNLIDRIQYGKVVDFLDFYLGSFHWPAFNVADSAISIGMTILVYHVLLNKIPDI